MPKIGQKLDENGRLNDEKIAEKLKIEKKICHLLIFQSFIVKLEITNYHHF